MSVLLRAYWLTGGIDFAKSSERALSTYDLPSGSGGVSAMDGGFVYYEETMPPYSPHILNGMIFAMYGALDAWTVLHDPDGKRIFDAGVSTLASNLQKYDSGTWSYYNQAKPPGLASKFYHQLHVQLLDELWRITGNSVFHDYSSKFATYLKIHRSE